MITSNASSALPAVRGWIGQRPDQLDLLEHRAGPAVGDDQRKRILLARPDVDEMNVEPVDVRHELREGIQLRFCLAPIVICRPVVRELPHRRELHALGLICDRLAVRPPGRRDPSAEIEERLFRNVDAERADCIVFHRTHP